MTRCVAYGCKETYGSSSSFFGFPKDPKLKKKWCRMIRRENFIPSEHSRLCSKHFKPEDIQQIFGLRKLKKGAVPCFFERDGIKRNRRKPPVDRSVNKEQDSASSTAAKSSDNPVSRKRDSSSANSTAVNIVYPDCPGKDVSVPVTPENSSNKLNEVKNSTLKKKDDDSVVADDTDVRKSTSINHSPTNSMNSTAVNVLHPNCSRKDVSAPLSLENSSNQFNDAESSSFKKTDDNSGFADDTDVRKTSTDHTETKERPKRRRVFAGDFKISDMASPVQAALFYESAIKIIEDKNKRIHFYARKTRTLQSKVQDLTSLLQLCQKKPVLNGNAGHVIKKPPARQDLEITEFREHIDSLSSSDECNESQFRCSPDFTEKTNDEVPSESGTFEWHVQQASQPSNMRTIGGENKIGSKGAPTNGSNVHLQDERQREQGNTSDGINVGNSIGLSTNGPLQPQLNDQSRFWMGNVPNVPVQLQNMNPYINNFFINCGSMTGPCGPPVNGLSQYLWDTYGNSCAVYGGNMPYMIGMRPPLGITVQSQQTGLTSNGLPVNVQMAANITSNVPVIQQEQRSQSKKGSISTGENIPNRTKNSTCKSTVRQSKDDIAIYCENVAKRLRTLGRSDMSVLIAKHEIDNILFKLEMRQFDKSAFHPNTFLSGSPSSSLPSEPSSVQATTSNTPQSTQLLPSQAHTSCSDINNLTLTDSEKCLPEQASNPQSSSSNELASNPLNRHSSSVLSSDLELIVKSEVTEEAEDIKHFNDILIVPDLRNIEKNT